MKYAVQASPDDIHHGGRLIRLGAVKASDIDVRAGAVALANIARFHGHTICGPYSVAQHCVMVSHIAGHLSRDLMCDDKRRMAMRWGLLHDWHESVIGDVASPLKRRLGRETDMLDALAVNIDQALCEAVGLPWPLPQWLTAQVHRADRIAYVTEVRDVTSGIPLSIDDPNPWPEAIKPLPWHRAADEWMRVWNALSAPAWGRA